MGVIMVDDLLHSCNISDIRLGIKLLQAAKDSQSHSFIRGLFQRDIQCLKARILHLGGNYDNR